MNQQEAIDWKRRKDNVDRIVAEQQAMLNRFSNDQRNMAQRQQEGLANRQNPMLHSGTGSYDRLLNANADLAAKQVWKEIAETRADTIANLRALCTFFQILAGGLTVALVSVLVL